MDIKAKRGSRSRKAHIDLAACYLDGDAQLPSIRALDFARTHDMSKEENIRTALRLLNREAAIVSIGRSVRVAVETVTSEPTVIGGYRLASHAGGWRLFKRADLIALYEGIQVVIDVGGSARTVTLADACLRIAWRRQFERVVFQPGVPNPAGALNLWRSWGVESNPGDWSLLHGHLLNIICGGDRTLFDWTLDWIADLFQKPHRKPGTALVFTGQKGTGKTKVAEWLAYVCGYTTIVDKPDYLTGNFNAHLANRILIVADEATWGGTKRAVHEARRSGSGPEACQRKFDAIRCPQTELQVHVCVAQHLRLRAVSSLVWWHTPNGELRDKAVATKLKAMGVLAGVPDLVLLHDGRAYWLELKSGTGRVSAEQRAVLAAFERAGASTAVAVSIEAALEILEA